MFGGGTGTELDPYLVEDAEDLNAVRNNLEAHYKQVADIDLGGANFEPIGHKPLADYDPFSGVYDGNRHKIINGNINYPTDNYIGLFAYLARRGEVRNLGIEGFDIVGLQYVGGITGYNGAIISGCYAMCSVSASHNQANVGGIAGYNRTTIEYSYVMGEIQGDLDVGGLVGRNNSRVEHCYSTCVVESGGKDDEVYSFGYNSQGQLGLGHTSERRSPTKLTALTNFKYISASVHTLAILDNGDIYSWGEGQHYKLGLGDTNNRNTPTKITTLSNVKQVSAGGWHSFALLENKDVYSWGSGTFGSLGHGDTETQEHPKKITALSDVKQVSAGGYHSLVLLENGDVYSFGYNTFGQLGLGDTEHRLTPTKITTLSNVKQIASGSMSSYALLENGDMYSWGYNHSGQLGLGDNTGRSTPTKITSLSNIKSVSAGGSHVLVTLENGDVYSCGSGLYGELGHGNTSSRNSFKKIEALSNENVKQVAVGSYFSLVLLENGDVYSFGAGWNGRLGHGNTSNRLTPTKIPNLSLVKSIVAGGGYSHVIAESQYDRVGGLVGRNSGTVISSYYNAQTSSQKDTGKGDSKTTLEMRQQATYAGWDFEDIWSIDPGTNEGYPSLNLIEIEPCTWIEIWTAEDLDNVRNNVAGCYIQMADIDLSGWGDWTAIDGPPDGLFTGIYDGNNYKITGLSGDSLFLGIEDRGVIQNVKLINVDINNGAAITSAYHSGKITNCYVSGNISGAYCGAISTGNWSDGEISKCTALVDIESTSSAGGMLCNNYDNARVFNCAVAGDIAVSSAWGSAGGFAESNSDNGKIYNCLAECTVKASWTGGFLCGNYGDATVEDCSTTGDVENTGNWSPSGGFVASASGGLISRCSALGNVVTTGNSISVGGFAGENYINIKECYCNGNVTASGQSSMVGGFAGIAYSDEDIKISNCYALGNVSAEEEGIIGGFIGEGVMPIENCYSKGAVIGTGNVGGFAGSYYGLITSCYYDSETSGQSDIGKGEPKTTTEMKTQETFVGWNFVAIWGIDPNENEGYPFLQWQIEPEPYSLETDPPLYLEPFTARSANPTVVFQAPSPIGEGDDPAWLLHFKAESYEDAEGTSLIQEVDSTASPELFQYSLDRGITWRDFPAGGLPPEEYGAYVKVKIEVGPRQKAYIKLSVGAEDV